MASVVMVSAVVVAGCSSQDSASQSPTQQPETSRTPSAAASPADGDSDQDLSPTDIWLRAVTTTSAIERATIDAQIITNVEGFERITQGDGYIDFTPQTGDLTWTDDRSTTREVRSTTGHYVELDGTWFEVPQALPTTVAFEPLAGLTDATDVDVEGNEDVLGRPTTKLTASLPPGVTALGFSDEELTVFDPESGSLLATIWVDDTDRIVRVLREYSTSSQDGDLVEAVSLFVLSGDTATVPIEVPETADAIPAPA